MAGLITHMATAREILKLLPKNIVEKPDLFYLGNIAPDAVHARKEYDRSWKKHSHFRDDIPDKYFHLPENYRIYHDRLVDFINDNKDREDGTLDFYRGYVTHIITDELYLLSVRMEFCMIMEQKGIGQNDRVFIESIIGDMVRNDMLLVNRYEGMNEIRDYVERAEALPVEGYISKYEMDYCRNWMIDEHFHKKHELLEPVYISYERTLEFIHVTSEEIVRRLSQGTELPKLF